MSHLTRLPCTRAEADAMRALDDPFPDHEDCPTVVATETPTGWELHLYTETAPDPGLLAALAALAPSADAAPVTEALPDDDWVTLSQAGLDPVVAGRFVIVAGAPPRPRPGRIVFRIDAGLAFGTAHHPTTAGCLLAIQRHARHARPRRVLDLGTGTGLLAFAAHRLHRAAAVTASDIDPTAIRVTRANARVNRVSTGRRAAQIHALTAPGLHHPALAARAPYDLILANILAGPLVALAPGLVAALAPGGTLVLAGLIQPQARRVAAAYTARGLRRARPVPRDEWPVLVLRKPGGAARARGVHATAGRRPLATTW